MRLEDLKKYVGEVVILDLVNGAQVTTKLISIEDECWAKIGKLLIFQVQAELHNPLQPPHPEKNPIEHKVRNAPYGFPLFEMKDETVLDIDHIIMAHDCPDDMAKVYHHVISGIQIADAGALNALDAAKSGKIKLQ